jgi:hypothetical protein
MTTRSEEIAAELEMMRARSPTIRQMADGVWYREPVRNGCDNCKHSFARYKYCDSDEREYYCERLSKHPKDDNFGLPMKPWDTHAMATARHDLEQCAWLKWANANKVKAHGICEKHERIDAQ